MKILVLLPESPFPWAGTASRYYGALLKGLDAAGHDVLVMSVRGQARGSGEPRDYFVETRVRFRSYHPPASRSWLERKLRSAWRPDWELTASRFGGDARELAGEFDLVLAEHPSTARAVEDLPHAVCSLQCVRHVDVSADRSASIWRAVQVRRSDRTTLRRIKRVRVLSARLAQLAGALAPSSRCAVVPLCIDPALYQRVTPPAAPTVGFVGSMFWEPSRAAARRFIERIVPRIRALHGQVRFVVAGWEAERYWSLHATRAGVELIDGFVNPSDVFSRLTVLVNAPPVGTGMKVKMLEAMAFGVPAVTNAEGAEGLDWDPAAPMIRAESDEAIAESVVTLLEDGALRQRLADEGPRCIERSFSPGVVAPKLVAELSSLISSPLSIPLEPQRSQA